MFYLYTTTQKGQMKKLLYFILIQILFSTFGLGQDIDTVLNDTSYIMKGWLQNDCNYITSSNITYQNRLTTNNTFNNTLIGFSLSGLASGGSLYGGTHYYFLQNISLVIPQNILINDSLNSKLIGYNFKSMLGLIDIFNKNYNIDLVILIGGEFGRLRLYGNPLLRKKNGYFAPKIEIQPKFKIKRLVLGGSFGYGYDISNPNWKNTWFSKDKSYTLDKLNQSGFSYQAFIGWSFN